MTIDGIILTFSVLYFVFIFFLFNFFSILKRSHSKFDVGNYSLPTFWLSCSLTVREVLMLLNLSVEKII